MKMHIRNSGEVSAILYTRVSTEEQATKGGSLQTQQDILRQYCHLRNIKIDKVFIEDHSAKTFNRPEWKKLMLSIENSTERPHFILFTRWDRFSRNTGDAYYTIKKLKKLGVESQAVEQPLDLSIPENKIMFAFYLAIPEVENDRRSLNTKMGMQRSKERGAWLGRAPIGYVRQTFADGSKLIIPKEPEASIIRFAYHQLANLKCNITDAYLLAKKEGIQCCRSNFWKLLQNPVYTGSIKIVHDEFSSSYLIPGLHKGIVSTPIFHKVQELFFSKKQKSEINRNTRNTKFPLKGFISCPRCNKTLSASASTGRSALYYYYHCLSKCGYRIRSEAIDVRLEDAFKNLTPLIEYDDVYKGLIQSNYSKINKQLNVRKSMELKAIELFTERIYKAKNLLLDGHIEFGQFIDIKTDLETKIRLLGYSIEVYTKKQLELSDKIENATNLFLHPRKLIKILDEKNKHSFLNNILIRSQNWELGNLNHIFKRPFRIVFGLEDKPVIGDETTDQEIKSFIRSITDMELLISN